MDGKVKFFNRAKGFGFVTGESGDDYFIHRTFLEEGQELHEGQTVTFEPHETEKGKQAKNIVAVDAPASTE